MFARSSIACSKFLSKSATKRLPLDNKRTGNQYYKGNTLMTKEGILTSKGFKLKRYMMLEIVPPPGAGMESHLKPYVAPSVTKYEPREYDPDQN
mmetsp:Transcript_10739/g.22056  ORF Transcript_10739/g.22056 Transcript_10739/m.22056 type:complete len:94 (-) Transcript_10739:66-347(-)